MIKGRTKETQNYVRNKSHQSTKALTTYIHRTNTSQHCTFVLWRLGTHLQQPAENTITQTGAAVMPPLPRLAAVRCWSSVRPCMPLLVPLALFVFLSPDAWPQGHGFSAVCLLPASRR